MSDDLIKREDAIEAYSDIYWIDDRLNLAFREELDKIDEKIRNIPTVEIADRPQGKWKAKSSHEYFCEKCGFSFDIMKCDFLENMKFCPNCGVMKGADDDEV